MPQIGRLNRILCIFGEMLLFLKICSMSLTLTLYGQLYAHLLGKMECHVDCETFLPHQSD